MNISISLSDTQVKKTLDGLSSGLRSFKQPLEEVGDSLIGHYSDTVFETQGVANGAAWRPLSAATLKLRAERRGYYAQAPKRTGKILIWTGKLQEGFKKTVSSTKLVIENNVDYFKYHQINSRPMLAITSDVITQVVEGLNNYIRDLIK